MLAKATNQIRGPFTKPVRLHHRTTQETIIIIVNTVHPTYEHFHLMLLNTVIRFLNLDSNQRLFFMRFYYRYFFFVERGNNYAILSGLLCKR